ncbi:protein of unknown function [Paraburkholderia kururiensis]
MTCLQSYLQVSERFGDMFGDGFLIYKQTLTKLVSKSPTQSSFSGRFARSSATDMRRLFSVWGCDARCDICDCKEINGLICFG